MPNYTLSYFGEPSFNSKEDGSKYEAKWMAWSDGIGAALVSPVTPLGTSKIVSSEGVTDGQRPGRLTGFLIVQADSIDAAIDIAKSCPHLEHGTIEVSEVYEM